MWRNIPICSQMCKNTLNELFEMATGQNMLSCIKCHENSSICCKICTSYFLKCKDARFELRICTLIIQTFVYVSWDKGTVDKFYKYDRYFVYRK